MHTVKSKGKISQNFVAFSEYMNFTYLVLKVHNLKNPNNHKAISTNASFAVETEDAHSDSNKLDHLAHCERIEIIGEAIEDSSVYLYPFIIEYSIIGISVVYRQEL